MPEANHTPKTTGSCFGYQINRADPEKQARGGDLPMKKRTGVG